jgi:hypothetical protein
VVVAALQPAALVGMVDLAGLGPADRVGLVAPAVVITMQR